MKFTNSAKSNSIFLGLCSLATQAVYLRFVLSSETGGELYAALVLGFWLLWVALGSFIGRRIGQKFAPEFWLVSALIKIPIALLIYVYPRFFTGILDPFQFLPLAVCGTALPGIIYGLIFASLITPNLKTSIVYRNEAIGSFIGGALVTFWALVGLGDFGLLIFLSFIEISRFMSRRALLVLVPAIGIILAIQLCPIIDGFSINLRWPDFDVTTVSNGLSGQWARISRGDQVTVIHGGKIIGSMPDREASEEALLWPLLYKPQCRDMLLVGFEGLQCEKYLPPNITATQIISDKSYQKLNIEDYKSIFLGDILSFYPKKPFDIINIQLQGASTLYNYRFETEFFFNKCRKLLKDDGILFVSVPFDENYVSLELARYFSSVRNTLKKLFPEIILIPGQRAGLVCFGKKPSSDETDILANIEQINIVSPYFNAPLIANRMMDYRVDKIQSDLDYNIAANGIGRPAAVFDYLKWQGSKFGKKSRVFDVYSRLFVTICGLILLAFIILTNSFGRERLRACSAVMAFGFMGMSLEIVILYLFQMIFGTLFLHLGLIMSVFMLGMAMGAGSRMRIRSGFIMAGLIFSAVLLMPVMVIGNSGFGLLTAGAILYIDALIIGFSAGGGFTLVANRAAKSGTGAALYGSDLAGAVMAVIIVPGVMISLGTFYLLSALILLSLVNYAALSFDKL